MQVLSQSHGSSPASAFSFVTLSIRTSALDEAVVHEFHAMSADEDHPRQGVASQGDDAVSLVRPASPRV